MSMLRSVGEFCELRVDGVLRSLYLRSCTPDSKLMHSLRSPDSGPAECDSKALKSGMADERLSRRQGCTGGAGDPRSLWRVWALGMGWSSLALIVLSE